MAGVGGMYSGIRGLDLGPTRMRLDEAFRRRQMQEDMRRALAGEKLQASELALRQNALQAQQEESLRRDALQRELQQREIEARGAENTAQRGFVGEQSALDRAQRATLQGQEIQARSESEGRRMAHDKEMQGLAQQGQWDMLNARLAQENDQFTKEFTLRSRSMDREEKFDALRSRGMELSNRAAQLQNMAEERRQAGMMTPQEEVAHRRAMADLERQAAMYQNEAARYASTKGRAMNERAAEQDYRLAKQAEEANARKMQPPAAPVAPAAQAIKKYANLDKSEQNTALRVDRAVAEGKGSDVQEAMAKAFVALNELAGADDEDAKDRAKKLREFIAAAKKEENANFSLPWWTGFAAVAANVVLPDSDLENMAEELGLISKGQ